MHWRLVVSLSLVSLGAVAACGNEESAEICFEDAQCGEDLVCLGGRCAEGVCPARPCSESQRCVSGVCLELSCETTRCEAGEVCVGGLCIEESCIGQVCAPDERCMRGRCVAAACSDGVRNGEESDIDCGGGCAPCGTGSACGDGADCRSGSCEAGICGAEPVETGCSDGARNGDETDVDCGGGCPPCAIGRSCLTRPDCQSNECAEGRCRDGAGPATGPRASGSWRNLEGRGSIATCLSPDEPDAG